MEGSNTFNHPSIPSVSSVPSEEPLKETEQHETQNSFPNSYILMFSQYCASGFFKLCEYFGYIQNYVTSNEYFQRLHHSGMFAPIIAFMAMFLLFTEMITFSCLNWIYFIFLTFDSLMFLKTPTMQYNMSQLLNKWIGHAIIVIITTFLTFTGHYMKNFVSPLWFVMFMCNCFMHYGYLTGLLSDEMLITFGKDLYNANENNITQFVTTANAVKTDVVNYLMKYSNIFCTIKTVKLTNIKTFLSSFFKKND